MATLIISQLLDDLVAIIGPAREAAAQKLADATTKAETDAARRWITALEVGYNWLLQQDVITFDLDHNELTVPSATRPGITYRANGACQCEAFAHYDACWHRSAARLVRRAREHRAQQAVAAAEAAERRELRRRTAYSEMAELYA